MAKDGLIKEINMIEAGEVLYYVSHDGEVAHFTYLRHFRDDHGHPGSYHDPYYMFKVVGKNGWMPACSLLRLSDDTPFLELVPEWRNIPEAYEDGIVPPPFRAGKKRVKQRYEDVVF